MSVSDSRFDDILAQMAGQAGGIQPLLDAFFGFLHRKTDFYVEFDPSEDELSANAKGGRRYSMGFPKGLAERMLIRSFRQFPMKDYTKQITMPTHPNPPSEPTSFSKKSSSWPPKVAGISDSVESTSSIGSRNASTEIIKTGGGGGGSSICVVSSGGSSSDGTTARRIQYTDAGKQVPIGNGGVGLGGRYYWTQTLKDLTVYADAPPGSRSKDITCTIRPHHLLLKVGEEVLIDGAVDGVVKPDESMWTLSRSSSNRDLGTPSSSRGEDGSHQPQETVQVVLTLDKAKQTWWKNVVEGHPEIDTNKVDSTQSISEYDEETQATIRRLMVEQQQKQQQQQQERLDPGASVIPTGTAVKTECGDSVELQRLLAEAAKHPDSPI